LPVRPYVAAGYVPRHISGLQGSILSGSTGAIQTLSGSGILREDVTHGVAVGGGVEIKAGRIRIGPEIRYTHWGEQPFRETVSRTSTVRSVDNQFEFLLGIRF
jgi:hypothetical protein